MNRLSVTDCFSQEDNFWRYSYAARWFIDWFGAEAASVIASQIYAAQCQKFVTCELVAIWNNVTRVLINYSAQAHWMRARLEFASRNVLLEYVIPLNIMRTCVYLRHVYVHIRRRMTDESKNCYDLGNDVTCCITHVGQVMSYHGKSRWKVNQ